MSYSSCYHCQKGVPYYDKYCTTCRGKFGLPDLPLYQQDHPYWPSPKEREAQFNIDRKETK